MGNVKYFMLIMIVVFGISVSAQAVSVKQFDTGPDVQGFSKESITDNQQVPETTFRRIFNQYVCNSLGKDSEDAILSRFKVAANGPFPAGVLTFQIFQKSKGTPMGHVRLITIVSVDGIPRGEVALSGWVDVFGPVLCLARSMNKGEVIEKGDVYLARKNISRMPSNVLTDKNMAIGWVLKNNLNQNDSLKEWMLKQNPTLQRGDRVTILAAVGGLKITVPGRTLAKGFVGDFIRVQNTMSRKNIYARIINNTTVEVDF
jgi:flagellar basal body P-ring formation protein FlgA